MNGPIQWTPNGFVSAMTSTSMAAQAPVVQSPEELEELQAHANSQDETDDDDDSPAIIARPAVMLKKPTKPPPPPKSISPKSVIKLARARLREVEADIKRLKKLETERDELRRLLDAAKSRPAAIVRELKRPAG